ncbi:glucosaminidase domain-containing protein [Evansella sp. AB-P1]|uniref:glucosaminidase domain-containing protein n=1 Tax=Evansella sp. AB-P1 TaxID=3037653 RepID=UPI00241ED7EE|nr:glucosaminidase domain-containing protein [Evansella sp. AB-P1]MDG5787062.1 glucosaminidase domain-containing protein [Evansella sp. AB-P1]
MKYKLFISMILLILFIIQPFQSTSHGENILSNFFPTPNENEEVGKNTNVYLPMVDNPTAKEQERFIHTVSDYAVESHKKWGIPAAAIIGMAALESGYGTTRIAHYANNLFGIKVWGGNSTNAWQLQGQPDEDFDRDIPVLANFGDDRIVYDETERRDNWYRKFSSFGEAVDYLTGTLLVNERYVFARDAYKERLKNGWSDEKATKEYLYDIANAGYNHLGGDYYKESVGRLIDSWNLLDYHVTSTNEQVSEQMQDDSHLLNKEIIESESEEEFVEEGTTIHQLEIDIEILQNRGNRVLQLQESYLLSVETNDSSEKSFVQSLQDVFRKIVQFFKQ